MKTGNTMEENKETQTMRTITTQQSHTPPRYLFIINYCRNYHWPTPLFINYTYNYDYIIIIINSCDYHWALRKTIQF